MEFKSELHSQMEHPERYDTAKDAFYDPDHNLNCGMPAGISLGDFIRIVDDMSEQRYELAVNSLDCVDIDLIPITLDMLLRIEK